VIRIRRTRELSIVEGLDRICLPGDEPVETDGRVWWVAERDGIPVGYAGVRPLPDQRLAYLCRAGVVPWARGLGIQRQLIKARLRWCKRAGLDPISDTSPENVHSANNLIACGFRLYQPHTPWAGMPWLYWRLPA